MKSAYEEERLEIIDSRSGSFHDEMKQDVLEGMTAPQKYLPSKYFYDGRGSALFERICGLPEYYQTRTELSILKRSARSLMAGLKDGVLIELGSGSNWKIRHLLDAVNGSRGRVRYVPVDVCESALVGAAEELLCLYPELCVSAHVADFTTALEGIGAEGQKLITFFGSTVGNFTDAERSRFFRRTAKGMSRGDRLLVGMDLVKTRSMLEAAYNDDRGITAEFNRNILSVINRELNADFDAACFDHVAFYNEKSECIEMHLRANEDTGAVIADLDLDVVVRRGETIFTEISRKFTKETATRMAEEAGLRITRWLTDRRGWFALAEMKRDGKSEGG